MKNNALTLTMKKDASSIGFDESSLGVMGKIARTAMSLGHQEGLLPFDLPALVKDTQLVITGEVQKLGVNLLKGEMSTIPLLKLRDIAMKLVHVVAAGAGWGKEAVGFEILTWQASFCFCCPFAVATLCYILSSNDADQGIEYDLVSDILRNDKWNAGIAFLEDVSTCRAEPRMLQFNANKDDPHP